MTMTRFITNKKIKELYDKMENLGIDVLIISDSEIHRNVNLKYLTGHPEDATLFLDIKNRHTILVPWDYQLANKYAEVDQIVNMADFGGLTPAINETMEKIVDKDPKIGVLGGIPYQNVRSILDIVPHAEIIYDPKKIDTLLDELRSTKSSYEISLLKKSFEISNKLVFEIEDIMTAKNEITTEMDLAVFVESRMRKLGAVGTGFETLVASSLRSWQIHTYPRADPELNLYRPGLALIDFGVNASGFTSDVTIPFVMGNMNDKMRKIVETVEQAHDSAIDSLKEVSYIHEVAEAGVKVIKEAGFSMPHALGHGIGLTVHDSPFVREKPTHESLLKTWTETPLEEGMVITIEPGIYEKDTGGFRLENDVIITNKGSEVATNSHTLYISL
jgi:Xaa-Pro dipeptidase